MPVAAEPPWRMPPLRPLASSTTHHSGKRHAVMPSAVSRGSFESAGGANNIGVVKRIDPPHSDTINDVISTTDGIEMIIVVI